MKKVYLFLGLILFIFSCTEDSRLENDSAGSPLENTKTINLSGAEDGVIYKLKDLAINPKLAKLTSENAYILSSPDEINRGILVFETVSSELSEQIITGNTLLIATDPNTPQFRLISSVTKSGNKFTLETKEAALGNIFSGGSLELSVDTEESEKALEKKKFALYKNQNYGLSYGFTFNWFKFITEFKSDALTYNPNTSITTTYNLKLGFDNTPIPNFIESYFELDTQVNPYVMFDGAVNKTYNHDFLKNMPANILDLLKNIELSLSIPTNSIIGDIPVVISMEKINMPLEVKANISKESHYSLEAGGILKIGFAYYRNIPNKKSHFIYENNIKGIKTINSKLTGEVITDLKISITPKIKVYDSDLIKIRGDIFMGINTFNYGNAGTSELPNLPTFGTRGNFYTSATFTVSTLGIDIYSTDLFKNDVQIWNLGTFNTTMNFSNFKPGKASILPCSTDLSSFSYDVNLDYKYPINGKKLEGNLEFTYDVYGDNGIVLASKKTLIISPQNITADNFKFNICIPFRRINIFSVAKTTYIKNITIKDQNGYVAKGILNPVTGIYYTEIKLTR